MNDEGRRLRLLLRMSLDDLVELAETTKLRSATILATAKRTGGDEDSAREESRQLAVVSAELSRLAEMLIGRARDGTLAEGADEVRLDD
jgi:hypothetical protein